MSPRGGRRRRRCGMPAGSPFVLPSPRSINGRRSKTSPLPRAPLSEPIAGSAGDARTHARHVMGAQEMRNAQRTHRRPTREAHSGRTKGRTRDTHGNGLRERPRGPTSPLTCATAGEMRTAPAAALPSLILSLSLLRALPPTRSMSPKQAINQSTIETRLIKTH